jgi:hypothetical protein
MTLPEQSNRAVAQTREFLVRLASPFVEGGIKGIRREVRAEALALLRHYPLSWNGDCPNQDNAANEDNAEVRRLRGAITALADQDATLTDEEREAVEAAARIIDGYDEEMDGFPSGAAATLRALLERL